LLSVCSAPQQLLGSQARQAHCCVLPMLAPGGGGGWKKPVQACGGGGCRSPAHATVSHAPSAAGAQNLRGTCARGIQP